MFRCTRAFPSTRPRVLERSTVRVFDGLACTSLNRQRRMTQVLLLMSHATKSIYSAR